MSDIFTFFHTRFKRISRPAREQVLCAMIRVNYGTPWEGDLKALKKFFPDWYHHKLVLGCLTDLIEALSPFSDEPTDPGIMVLDENALQKSPTATISRKEVTAEITGNVTAPSTNLDITLTDIDSMQGE